MCEMLHAKLPQQERLQELWKGERVAEGLVCRRERSGCALAAPERLRDHLWSGCASCIYREGSNPSACADSVTADAGKGAGAPRRMHPHIGGAEGGGRDETSSTHGPEDGPGASQISSSGREGARGHAEGPGELRASAAGGNKKAQSDLHKLMQEAPLPVTPAPQVNMNLVKSLEALTGLIENMWNLSMQFQCV